MGNLELMRRLHQPADTKIILLVIDGLGGLPIEPGGPTELEAAETPNLDQLAAEGTLGLSVPVRPGITPGSGPAHLSLFGYDPLEFDVGRGVIEAAGIGLKVQKGDLAARGNFATVNEDGLISDRRAGRISSEEARPLVKKLQEIELPGVEPQVEVLREYRFALVLRGQGLTTNIADTDPLETGEEPLPATALDPESEAAAGLINQWISAAREKLADQPKANALTLRGFSTNPALPQFGEIYGLQAGCIAVYPMYRGVARLVGMQVLDFELETPQAEFETAAANLADYDFLFIHIKKPDSLGEDGDFHAKAGYIATIDQALPILMDANPDVLVVTGDHSTPARLRYHSWHPVPTLLWAPESARPDIQSAFGESRCLAGGLGIHPAYELMPQMMAHARRLEKYGA